MDYTQLIPVIFSQKYAEGEDVKDTYVSMTLLYHCVWQSGL